MSPKETEIHEKIDRSLTNLLDRIDLTIWHIEQSNEDYEMHVRQLLISKSTIKKILNEDFDRLARGKK